MEEHSVLLLLLFDFKVDAVVVLEEQESWCQLGHQFSTDQLEEFAEEVPGHVSRLLLIILLQQRQRGQLNKKGKNVGLIEGKGWADACVCGQFKANNRNPMQSTLNSFFIRTIQPSRSAADPPKQSITIQPSTVEFNDYPSSKISISKLTLKNQSKFHKKISVTQPSKAYFQIKLKGRDIAPRETSEIYIIFNPQREKTRIEDEFCIKMDGDSNVIHVPIVCQYKSATGSKGWSSKQIISNKENEEEKVQKSLNVRSKRTLMGKNRHVSIDHRQSNFIDLKRITLSLFLEKFDRISKYVEEKKVKNEVYLGENQLEPATKRDICQYAQKIQEINRRTLHKAISTRFAVEYHEQGPVIQMFNGVYLNWDASRNNAELIFRNGMGKIQEEVRKFIVSLRFEKIQNYLKIYKEYQFKEESQGKSLRVQDYLQYLDVRLQNNKCMGQLQFQFDKNSLKHQQVMIDYQRGPIDCLFRQRNIRFQIVQRIGFDNWIPMNIIRESQQEIYHFNEHHHPNHYIHMPTYIRDNRKGAQSQLPFRSATTVSGEEELGLGVEFSCDLDGCVGEMLRSQEKYYHQQREEPTWICADAEKWLQSYINEL